MAYHPPQVAASVRSAIQVLNNDILVVALNNNRVRNDANRFAAEFSTCMGETIALMTKVVHTRPALWLSSQSAALSLPKALS